MTTTTNPTVPTRPALSTDDHNRAIIGILRACAATKVPVRLRRDSAVGPVAEGYVHAVHKNWLMDFAEESINPERFGDSAVWRLDMRTIHSVEVLTPLAKDLESKAAREARLAKAKAAQADAEAAKAEQAAKAADDGRVNTPGAPTAGTTV